MKVDDDALRIAREIFTKADTVVRERTGSGIVANAFDIAAPAILRQTPALAILLPIIRRIMLPMIENALTAEQHTEIAIAVQTIEDAMTDMLNATMEAKARIDAMTDDEVDAYILDNNLIRNE